MRIMGRKKNYLALIALIACVGTAFGQDYFDDIYYNPKKDKAASSASNAKKAEKVSYYIENMGDMDVDAYNRRGSQYYTSQIDTIGSRVENGEDFVYTQQIQKFYNPTIVVDNASALGDVLANAHGNVEIVINNNGIPVFAPWYGYNWNWPYYSSVWSPWSWSWNWGSWGWSIGWYDPWFSWGWGPAWGPGWGPGWRPGPNWGWGPAWRPGPSWGPGPGPAPRPMATWSPRGNQSVGPRPGWSSATQPGRSNITPQHKAPVGGNRAPSNARPGSMPSTTRPAGVVNNNGRWEYNTSNSTGHRTAGTGVINSRPSNNNNGKVINTRPTTTTNRNNNAVNNNRRTTTNNNSYSPSRSSNSSFGGGSRSTSGGGRSTGGGGGGRHR